MKEGFSRARVLVLGTLCVGFVCAFILVFGNLPPREPTCRGMPLSKWLAQPVNPTIGEGIAEIGPEAIPFLIRKLTPPNPALNRLYARLYASLPTRLRQRLPWPHQGELERKNALVALREFGEEAKAALPAVLRAVHNDPSFICRTFAMNAALSIGYDDSAVASTFAGLLDAPSSRDSAAAAIWNTGYWPAGMLEHLLPGLRDEQKPPFNQLLAVSAMGPEGREAVPLIIEALKNSQLHGNAVAAISRIGPGAVPAVPGLIELLKTLQPMSLVKTCEALMNIGPPASNAGPDLNRLLAFDDMTVRIVAAAAVAKISGQGETAVPILIQGLSAGQRANASWQSPIRRFGLDHYSFNSRMAAAWFLGELAPDSRKALPILRQAFENCPEYQIPVIARAIWKIEGKPSEVLPFLKQALRSKQNEMRVLACTTLAEIGPAAREAIPDLQAACKTGLNTRRAALQAIKRIQ